MRILSEPFAVGSQSARPVATLGALLSLSCAVSFPANAEPTSCPQPFTVTLDVEWHGMNAGTSTLQLKRNSATDYTYTSSNKASGFFKLAIPDTITQTSNFTIVDGKVRPGTYVGDDGSSDTDKDVSLNFDWKKNLVTGTAENKPVSEQLEPGVQDSLSVQVALMCALAAGQSPKSFQLIDKDKIKEYQYRREGDATLDTPVGKLDTVVYTSQRVGANRLTRLWIAPSLGYLPVRAEQLRKGKRELQLKVSAVERSPQSPGG